MNACKHKKTMGGRQHFLQRVFRSSSMSSKRAILATFVLIVLIIPITLCYLSFHNRTKTDTLHSSSKSQFGKAHPQHSFVLSLEKFLKTGSPWQSLGSSDNLASVDDNLTQEAAKRLDDAMWARERLELTDYHREGPFPLRVYVYDMPSKFTFDLLWLFHTTYQETANLTSNGSPVHRLIEQHSIDYWLWADLIAPESERQLKTVVRVHRQEEADLFYIPFFTTISYFLLEKAECKQLYRVCAHVQVFFSSFLLKISNVLRIRMTAAI